MQLAAPRYVYWRRSVPLPALLRKVEQSNTESSHNQCAAGLFLLSRRHNNWSLLISSCVCSVNYRPILQPHINKRNRVTASISFPSTRPSYRSVNLPEKPRHRTSMANNITTLRMHGRRYLHSTSQREVVRQDD